MKKVLKYSAYGFVALTVIGALFSPSEKAPKVIEQSSLSFSEVDQEIGCGSPYSEEKKEAIFEEQLKGKQFHWEGRVTESDNGEVKLKMKPATFTFDLEIELMDKKQGFDLVNGQWVSFAFTLNSVGGCIIPYTGDNAVINI